jgi:hypothetical protein
LWGRLGGKARGGPRNFGGGAGGSGSATRQAAVGGGGEEERRRDETRRGRGRKGEAHHPPFHNSNVTVWNVGLGASRTVGSGHGRPGLAGGAFNTRRKIPRGIPVLSLPQPYHGRHTCQAAPAVVQVRCAHVPTPISGINRNL